LDQVCQGCTLIYQPLGISCLILFRGILCIPVCIQTFIGTVCLACGAEISQSGGQIVQGNVYFQCEDDKYHDFGHPHWVKGQVVVDSEFVTKAITDASSFCNDISHFPCDYHLNKDSDFAKGPSWSGMDVDGNGKVVVCLTDDTDFKEDVELCTEGGLPLYVKANKIKTDQGKVTLCSNLAKKNVVWNVQEEVASSGGGGGTGCCKSVLTGTLCVIDGKVSLSPGYVDGPIYSQEDINLSSGSIADCPISPPSDPTPAPVTSAPTPYPSANPVTPTTTTTPDESVTTVPRKFIVWHCLFGSIHRIGFSHVFLTPLFPFKAGGYGDPHFHTWHDQDFEFHGQCDMVLLRAPLIDLDIHVRTTHQFDFSYISQAAVRMGKDTFQVESHGEYMLNDIDNIDLPAAFGDNHLVSEKRINKKKTIFTINLGSGVDIEIVVFKHFVSIKVLHGKMELFHNASGMMGHFETTGGDMLARDGSIMDLEDPNAIGNEWQVRPKLDGELFAEARQPQYPAKCELPPANAFKTRRKLGESAITKEDAESACAGVGEHRRVNCVSDVMKTGDKEMADSY